MNDLTSLLGSLAEDLRMLREVAADFIENETDPALREHMLHLDELLADSFKEMQETLPLAEEELNNEIAKIERTVADAQQELARMEQGMEKAVAEAAGGVPVPPPIPFDPRLGLKLRDDLLRHFAAKTPAPPTHAGDVASMASEDFVRDDQSPGHRPPIRPTLKNGPDRESWTSES